jgi:hypothetical protein
VKPVTLLIKAFLSTFILANEALSPAVVYREANLIQWVYPRYEAAPSDALPPGLYSPGDADLDMCKQ